MLDLSDPRPRLSSGIVWFILFLSAIILGLPLLFLFLTSFFKILIFPENVQFLAGYYTAAVLILAPILIWIMISRFRYRIPAKHSAILQYRGRTWEFSDPGGYWMVPFIEQVKAFISLENRTSKVFVHEFLTAGGVLLTIHARVPYAVKSGLVIWQCIQSSFYAQSSAGMARPASVAQTNKCVENHIQQLVRRVLVETANDPTKGNLFFDKAKLEASVLDRLKQEADQSGIEFDRIEIEAFTRNP